MIYDRSSCKLLSSSAAKNYLDDPFHEVPRSDPLVVETVKLSLRDLRKLHVHKSQE